MSASLTILVVEDNVDARQIVCELLALMGHAVSWAPDGERAWELIQARSFDVLLTDVSLPGMSGIALARRAQLRQPAPRIIFSTGYDKGALDGSGIRAAVLRKPYELAELKAALDSAA